MKTVATIIFAYLIAGVFFAAAFSGLVWLTKHHPKIAERIDLWAEIEEGAPLREVFCVLVLAWPRLMWFFICNVLSRFINKEG